MYKRGTTVYLLLSVCSGTPIGANRPSHEVVGSGCDNDTDSDDSDVDLILNYINS